MEDPSENFQRLRDFVDVRNCMRLNNFQPDYLLEGFHDAMAEEARKKLKLNRVKDSTSLLTLLSLFFYCNFQLFQFTAPHFDVFGKKINPYATRMWILVFAKPMWGFYSEDRAAIC